MKAARPRSFLRWFLPGSIRHRRRVSAQLSFPRRDGVVHEVRLRNQRWVATANTDFSSLHPPSTLVIVGSGPSIRNLDMAALPPNQAMLLNGTISLMPEVDPFAIVMEDRRFVDRHWDMLRACLPLRPRMIVAAEVLSAIAEREPDALHSEILLNDSLFKPVGAKRRDGWTAFATNPHEGTMRGGSVAVIAFQWAVALRPKRIAFAGVELWNAGTPRFYEGSDMAKTGIVGAEKRILRHIEAGTQLALERGIEVVNVSAGSSLETIGIPTIPFADLTGVPDG